MGVSMVRSCYEKSIPEFLDESTESIFGEIDLNYNFQSTKKQQKNAWIKQIDILKEQLSNLNEGIIIFEYDIPRMSHVIDNIILTKGLIFVLEFKVDSNEYEQSNLNQLDNYVQLLENYHEESTNKVIVPILVETEAESFENTIRKNEKNIFDIIKANKNNLSEIMTLIINQYQTDDDLSNWSNSRYAPTPTILKAARDLYKTHQVGEIDEHSSKDIFLNETEKTIDEIIEDSKNLNKKSIIFLTGVPGAGKTLIGLNIAVKRSINNKEDAVFLSGNDPLVEVLWEALARDNTYRNNISKDNVKLKVKSFIQKLHKFRDDAINNTTEQHEQIVIFDEAQRAWTKEETENFMKRRKNILDFGMSEPEFLISIMDRRQDWAVIICLVGQGQEINKGEAGINEWLNALERNFTHWEIYVNKDSLNLNDEYEELKINDMKSLYLYSTIRSLDAPNLPNFIKYLLDNDKSNAKKKLIEINKYYPVFITRNLKDAKKWIKQEISKHDDNENIRTGLLAHSKAIRLIPEGIFVKWEKSNNSIPYWFLNDITDIRSSNHLELPATEFDIQGLEIDYSIVCWDANLRYQNNKFEFKEFTGTKWNNINQEHRKNYLLNSYRVLLTRARRGMVIFVPKGDDEDPTRKKEYYNGTYGYLKSIGIKELQLD